MSPKIGSAASVLPLFRIAAPTLFSCEACSVQIRWMVRSDISIVAQIERLCFGTPWSEEDFVECLQLRNCVGVVAEHAGRVVGFAMYETPRNRLHILNLGVHPDFRRSGIGRQIIVKLQNKLAPQRRHRITLEVRETNLMAQIFLRSLGFRAVAVLKNFYDESSDDAYLMQYRIPRDTLAKNEQRVG